MTSEAGDVEAEEVPRESIRAIDDFRNLRIEKGRSLKHEIGAGSPCNKCGPACDGGLDLHFWRKICKNCKCPPENHDIKDDTGIQLKIGKLFGEDHEDLYGQFYELDVTAEMGSGSDVTKNFKKTITESGGDPTEKITFEWIPQNTPKNVVLKYISALPVDKQPIRGTAGAVERTKQLQSQLPTHDVDPSACKSVKAADMDAFNGFVTNYKQNALGIGNVKEQLGNQKWVCDGCKRACLPGSVAVFAERAPGKLWHPGCFTCCTCNELLVDLIYFWDEPGGLYCGRHYADKHRPRCHACDELIMSGQYTQAEDVNWHVEHFCCWNCDTLLGGHQYINKENHPYCMNCYTVKFAKTCCTCLEKIEAVTPRFSHNEFAWHATPQCFKCIQCTKDLINKQFIVKNGVLYCSKVCRKTHAANNTVL